MRTKLNIPKLEPRDRSIQLPRIYHVSPYIFDQPEYTQCVAKARADEKHPNGVLGLWASPSPNLFDKSDTFGPHVYELTLRDSCNQLLLKYDDLKGWDDALRYDDDCPYETYRNFREDLLMEKVDVMFVLDGWHNVGEIIIVNLEAIETFVRTTDYASTDAPLTKNWGKRRPMW